MCPSPMHDTLFGKEIRMKVYIDDERAAPEGWHPIKTFHEALRFVPEHAAEITHIAFDWQLSMEMPAWNGVNLLREFAGIHFNEEPIFTQPRSHYTCHSSDASVRAEMEEILDLIFAVDSYNAFWALHEPKPKKAAWAPKDNKTTGLRKLLKAKRR